MQWLPDCLLLLDQQNPKRVDKWTLRMLCIGIWGISQATPFATVAQFVNLYRTAPDVKPHRGSHSPTSPLFLLLAIFVKADGQQQGDFWTSYPELLILQFLSWTPSAEGPAALVFLTRSLGFACRWVSRRSFLSVAALELFHCFDPVGEQCLWMKGKHSSN